MPQPTLTATPSATIRLGAPQPYLKTHGTKVARLHLFDWLVLVLLAIIDVVLNLIQPFYRFVGEDMMTSLRYPMKDNTVPVWAVPIYAVIAPIIIFTVIYLKRRNVYDLHHAILGSFAGLGFLSWYLAGKIKAFDRGGHIAKLCIVILPLLLAAMVAVSRVDDYWHHWQDVFAGGILGLVVASFCYLQFFPPPSGEQGMIVL
ncbi:hypothetical protein PR202_ga05861 [Eleusine coracana subsp. coracana]|uniref:Phosphatidic acid phosphatase type 2/haloperoxidase domain-containing protein n=1 Tax=Eleusine coracana subsp. coracana TaxID=191504 RepID=A0AAV5BTI4_ELECO|nr:hypothetical protein PR202_ga05861 [Eleusine coracana subsp. coracana]